MYTDKNILYAEPFHFLKHFSRPVNCLSVPADAYNHEDFEELPISSPIVVEIVGNKVYFENRKFCFIIKRFSYDDIVEQIIKSRYSNDKQLAVMLNKDRSDEAISDFNRMQLWRMFAKSFAIAIMDKISSRSY